MHLSTIERRRQVAFPAFTGERVYMEPIYNAKLPARLARWAITVDCMLAGLVPRVMYLMVDQQALVGGQFHRRPGIHVDGYWGADHKGAWW
jgi:hypothetical protein